MRRAVHLVLLVVAALVAGCGDDAEDAGAPVSSGAAPQRPVGEDRALSGRVSTPGGAPIEGAFIAARPLGPDSPPVPDIAVFTDAAGRFSWALPAGRFEVTVTADGHRPAKREVRIAPGAPAELDVALQPTP